VPALRLPAAAEAIAMKRLVVAIALIAGAALAAVTSVGADQVPLRISIVGNHFVNASGQTIRLLGVDEPGTEYACSDGYGYGADDATQAAAIASWHANAVRIPLNEECWLGTHDEPAYGTATGYRQYIEDYVSQLNADGIYAILDLHWSDPGDTGNDGQHAMPDDNSVAFWTSVAGAFEDDPAVVFDAFNEPFSPGGNYPVDWSCWENGNQSGSSCEVPTSKDGDPPSGEYPALGMQAMVNAIRTTGATQPIILGGLSYANDLSQWLTYEPTDTLNPPQLAASFHNYEGEACDDVACWNSQVAPVAAQVPVVTGEFDETQCDTGTTWDDGFMNWADQNGISYLAWGWWDLGSSPDCNSNYWLISDSSGTPSAPNGTALHDHLAALYAASQPPTTTTTTTSSTGGGPPPSIRHRLTNELAALLRSDRKPTSAGLRFRAPAPGVLSIRWSVPATRHRRTVLVAGGSWRFASGQTKKVRPSLTASGRRVLRRDRRARLTVRVSFAARGGPTVSSTASVRL
jgi:endoglucanase